MNINFKTHFPWPDADGEPEPTHFKEQVLNSVNARLGTPLLFQGRGVKLHTIRRIKNGKPRFREGMKLTFSMGPRFKPERFGEAVCTGVQQLRFEHATWVEELPVGSDQLIPNHVLVISQLTDVTITCLPPVQRYHLALNDGFPDLSTFERWFLLDVLQNGPGDYQLVHWTDLRY